MAYSLKYRPDIDGLRALAVLLVLGFHAFPETLRSGFMGVDIFFVISGYLITALLIARRGEGLRAFYARRVRRLAPALVTVLAASWLFGAVALLPSEFAQLGRHMLAAATFSSNFVYWYEASYFDSANTLKPLIHLWSLAIEEQFYLLFPFLLAWFWRRGRSPEACVLLLLVASLGLSFLMRDTGVAGFYAPFTRWWELLMGAALAFAAREGESPAGLRHLWVPGVALLGAGIWLITGAMPYPGAMALLPTLGTALLIMAGPRALANRVLGLRPLAALGRMSYPLYLWHWPLLSYAHIIAPEPPSAALRWALLGAALLLAAATYRWIERPLRYDAARTRVLVLAVLALGGLGLATHLGGGLPMRPAGDYVDNRDALRRMPADDAACRAYAPLPGEYCRYRDADGPRTVALLGDSFAQVAFPGMADYLRARGVNTLLLGHPGCPGLLQPETASGHCPEQARAALHWLAAQPEISDVFFFARGSTYVSGDRQMHTPPQYPAPQYRAMQQAAIDLLRAAGKRVFVVMENPHTGIQPGACIPRPLRSITHACSVDRAWVEEGEAGFRAMAALLHGATVIDPLPAFCDAAHCRLFHEGVLLYGDDAHVSPAGSAYLTETVLAPHLP